MLKFEETKTRINITKEEKKCRYAVGLISATMLSWIKQIMSTVTYKIILSWFCLNSIPGLFQLPL